MREQCGRGESLVNWGRVGEGIEIAKAETMKSKNVSNNPKRGDKENSEP